MKKKKTPVVFIIISVVFLVAAIAFFSASEHRTDRLYASIVCFLLSIVFLVADRTIRLKQIQNTLDEINGKINNKEL